MATKKVILNNTTIIDLSGTTATEQQVLEGYKFFKSNGDLATGTLVAGSGGSVEGYSVTAVDHIGKILVINGMEYYVSNPLATWQINTLASNDNFRRTFNFESILVAKNGNHVASARYEENPVEFSLETKEGTMYSKVGTIEIHNKNGEVIAQPENDHYYILQEGYPMKNIEASASLRESLQQSLDSTELESGEFMSNFNNTIGVYDFVFYDSQYGVQEEEIETPVTSYEEEGEMATTYGTYLQEKKDFASDSELFDATSSLIAGDNGTVKDLGSSQEASIITEGNPGYFVLAQLYNQESDAISYYNNFNAGYKIRKGCFVFTEQVSGK